MVYAQIKNGVVVNTISVDDASIVSLFRNDPTTGEAYDFVLQIDQLYPRPGIGWLFNEIMFIQAADESQLEGSKDPTPPPEQED